MSKYILHAEHPNRDHVRQNAHEFIDRLPSDKDWQIEVSEWHEPRTDKQRRSLFGVAYKAIMDQTGLEGSRDKDQLHLNMCGEFFGWRDDPILGRVPVRTTTRNERGERDEISIGEQLRMYEFIQRLVARYGVDVPNPDPFWREKATREAA